MNNMNTRHSGLSFPDLISRLRNLANLSRKDFASKLGVKLHVLASLESPHRKAYDPHLIWDIIKALDLCAEDADELLLSAGICLDRSHEQEFWFQEKDSVKEIWVCAESIITQSLWPATILRNLAKGVKYSFILPVAKDYTFLKLLSDIKESVPDLDRKIRCVLLEKEPIFYNILIYNPGQNDTWSSMAKLSRSKPETYFTLDTSSIWKTFEIFDSLLTGVEYGLEPVRRKHFLE